MDAPISFPKHATLGSTARGFCAKSDFATEAANYIDDCFLTPFVEKCRAFLAYLELTDSAYALKKDKANGFNQIAEAIASQYPASNKDYSVNEIKLKEMTFTQQQEGEHTYVYMGNGEEKIKIRKPMTLCQIIEKSRLVMEGASHALICPEDSPKTISDDFDEFLGYDLVNTFGFTDQLRQKFQNRPIG